MLPVVAISALSPVTFTRLSVVWAILPVSAVAANVPVAFTLPKVSEPAFSNLTFVPDAVTAPAKALVCVSSVMLPVNDAKVLWLAADTTPV